VPKSPIFSGSDHVVGGQSPPSSHCEVKSRAIGATVLGVQQSDRRKKMIVEGAWILVVAGVVFAGIIVVVLVTSGKLYNPDRSHE